MIVLCSFNLELVEEIEGEVQKSSCTYLMRFTRGVNRGNGKSVARLGVANTVS